MRWVGALVLLGIVVVMTKLDDRKIGNLETGHIVELSAETWGCEWGARESLGRYDDRESFGRAIREFEQTGRCIEFKRGTKLKVTNIKIWQQATEVRMEGQTKFWWVTTPVLEQNSRRLASARASSHFDR